MAESEIKFDSRAAKKFFDDLKKNTEDISEMHKKYVDSIGALVFQDIMDHFAKEQGSQGRWKSWSKIYAERMQKAGKGGNKILQDNGHLRQSFKPTAWRLKSKGIEWYNNAQTKGKFPYAYAHDTGGPRLPKRDFMWLSERALERISNVTAAWALSGSDKGA